ncbi:MAG: hypothetical protein Q9201_002368 [Fulgogasparrea decipioides]
MSFLNSVLSTIGGDGQQMPLPQSQPSPRPKQQTNGSNIVSRTKSLPPHTSAPAAGQKRKADDVLPTPQVKALRDDRGSRQVNGALPPDRSLSSKEAKRPSISISKSSLAVPYRGTSKPSPTSASPDTPTSDTPKAAPKKGSYAEIMARAAANNKASVGVIKHKPKDAISAKKEILMRKKGIIPKGKASTQGFPDRKIGRESNSPKPGVPRPQSPGLPNKKPQPSYKGTAALKPQPAYKGTMKPTSSTIASGRKKPDNNDRSRSSSINPPRRGMDYESEDEEEDLDGDEEEEQDYYDESDDMEAGFGDVEEEETAATRAAKKEDDEELRIENQLKKEKEERRKKLAAMAAKAPKPRY